MADRMKLYEIAAARDILDEFLSEEGGEFTAELEALLDELDGQTTDKVQDVALYVRECLAVAESLKTHPVVIEAARVLKRAKAKETAADRTKRYLERQLEKLGKEKVEGTLVTVAMQLNNPAVKGELTEHQLRELSAIHPEWVTRVPEQFVLDRVALIQSYKAAVNTWEAANPLPKKPTEAQRAEWEAARATANPSPITGITIERSKSVRIR